MRLEDLLDRNERHVGSIDPGYFDGVRESQHPTAVSVCCSDSRVPQERMWNVDEAGWLFTSANIGNQVWDEVDGDRVVDGNLLYPIAHTGTRSVLVVGHTGCGAVTAAYNWVTEDIQPTQPGIRRMVGLLVPVVEEGLGSQQVDVDVDDAAVVNQLVEYLVQRQTEFLVDNDEIPDDVEVYGFVYDFQAAYGGPDGRTYLVSRDGDTDPELPEGYGEYGRSLLD